VGGNEGLDHSQHARHNALDGSQHAAYHVLGALETVGPDRRCTCAALSGE
jgi:hypothetical protein